MRVTRGFVLTLGMVGAVCPAAAMAGKVAVVVRGVGAGSDKAAGFVSHYLTEIVGQDARYDVVELSDALGGGNAERAKRAFEVAEEMVQKGRNAYETLDLDPAIEYLNTALTKYERHAAEVQEIKKVAEVLMLLGATHILRGEEQTGAKRLAQAIAIYPDIEPDPRIFNPGMRQVFQDAADRLGRRPQGTLSITSNPSYARVYMDGAFVGVTPLAVDKITEGRHFIRLAKAGYADWGRVIDVIGQVEATDVATLKATDNFEELDALVEAALPSVPGKEVGDPVGEVFRQLGVLLGVESLLLTEVRLDGERVRARAILVDVNEAKVQRSGSQTFSYDSRPDTYRREILALWQAGFGDGTAVALGDDGAGGEDPSSVHAAGGECYGMSCSKFKTVVLAVGAGSGALLGLLGGLLDYLAYVDHNNYRQTPQTSPEAESLRKSGITKSIIGDVLLGLGVATAAASVGFFFLYEPAQSAESVAPAPKDGWGLWIVPCEGGLFLSTGATF